MTLVLFNSFLAGILLAILTYLFTAGFLYWPIFDAVLGSPEAKGLFVGVNFVLMIVSACGFTCAVGFRLFLMGARR